MKKIWLLCVGLHAFVAAGAQDTQDNKAQQNRERDSLYIAEVEKAPLRDKVLHAEPLYIDLIRDLGARKGEREWNAALGLTDKLKYNAYEMLIEYEWAPIDRLGLEVEVPMTLYTSNPGSTREEVPDNKIESLKLAAQWSFFVSERISTSMALGYIHEFELNSFRQLRERIFTGNTFNPFLIVAKRWGTHYHTLLYTGPRLTREFGNHPWEKNWQINSNVHYMIPGTRNFIGIEVNKELNGTGFDIVLRPQMRVAITDNLLIGIVSGIPMKTEGQRFSTFTRLIWEPHPKKKH